MMTAVLISGLVALIIIVGGVLIGSSMDKKAKAEADKISAKAHADSKIRIAEAEAKKAEAQAIKADLEKGNGQIKRKVIIGSYEAIDYYPMAAVDYGKAVNKAVEMCKEVDISTENAHFGPGIETLKGMAILEAAKNPPATPSATEKKEEGQGPTSFDINFRFLGLVPEDGKVKKPPAPAGDEKEKADSEPADSKPWEKKSLLGD